MLALKPWNSLSARSFPQLRRSVLNAAAPPHAALSAETVLALAPDSASAQAARKLSSPAKWPTLNASSQPDTQWLWGECQGSGSKPYLVGVDLRTAEYACKCSCPSRKFPCKHGLALLLLHVAGQQGAGQGGWGAAAPPEVLVKWLDGRRTRNEAAAQADGVHPELAAPTKAVDPAAKAKREAARHAKIGSGLEDLHLWMQDLIRGGLPAARKLPYRTWDAQAARLIDAQAPGAARLVRQIPDALHLEHGEALLAHLGKLALLCEGWANRDALTEPERLQLLGALGQPLDSAALLAGHGTPEAWTVMGHLQEQEGRLDVRRTWLRRVRDGHAALILDFGPTGRGFTVPSLPSLHTAALGVRFVPTLHPQRALLAGGPELPDWRPEVPDLPAASIADLYAAYAQALALNPWLERIAFSIGPVRVLPDPAQAQDAFGHAVVRTTPCKHGNAEAHDCHRRCAGDETA